MIRGIDFSAGAAGWSPGKYQSFYRAAKDSGVVFAVRYLKRGDLGWQSKKELTVEEFGAAKAEDVRLAFFYEESERTPTEGAAAGIRHANEAAKALADLGLDPTDQPVIYATDFDAKLEEVIAYYYTLKSILGVKNVWAYGGYFLVRDLFDAGVISGACQTIAWSKMDPSTGQQSYDSDAVLVWEDRAQLRQDTLDTWTIDGVPVEAEFAPCYYGACEWPEEVVPPGETVADLFIANAHKRLGMGYEWSDEFTDHIGPDSTPQEDDGDCSGYLHITYKDTGIRWKTGSVWPRLTANGYMGHAVRVTDGKYRVGDPLFRVDSGGTARHTGFICHQDEDGTWWTAEARGEAWGVVTYKLTDKTNGMVARGARVYRFPWVQMGDGTPVEIEPMLRYGDESPDVKRAQLLLNKHMGPVLQGTGYFGRLTLDTTQRFQALKGLEVDGIVGPITWAALKAATYYEQIRIESGGEYVKLAKYWLNRHINSGLHEDNPFFGSKTDAETRRYQTLESLEVDGVIGPATWASLLGGNR
jgi:peptidoglycan hydrolase-like protein with peptidoglycan-binding domain